MDGHVGYNNEEGDALQMKKGKVNGTW